MSFVTDYDQILNNIYQSLKKIEDLSLLEIKNDLELLSEEVQKDNINSLFDFKDKYLNNEELNNHYEFKKLLRLINELLDAKNNPKIVEIWDDFLTGHCHEFAISLNKVFGYKIGMITGQSKDIFGNELTHLFHAFAIDKDGKAFDIEGAYSISSAIKGYENNPNPKTGNIAYNINFSSFDSISDFINNIFDLPVDQSFINQGIKRITKNPLLYFNTISLNKNEDFALKTNTHCSLSSEYFYQYKNKNRLFELLSINIKKDFKPINKTWIFNNIHSIHNGFKINLGLGSYDFDLISIKVNINQEIDDSLSDKESIDNIKDYFLYIQKNISNYIKI